ncbi:MAG: carbohydrate kinase family protein [Candidatus Paceibacterota bacterium]
MFRKQIDILSIGDLTTDAFIRLKDAHVHCEVNHNDRELCVPFGGKIPFEYIKIIKAVGNAGNSAVTASRLGLNSALVSNIGDDSNGHECLAELQKNKVITSFIKEHKNRPTNYHFVLWYDVDRTILVNHVDYEYHLPKFPTPKWIYLTSVGANTRPYHMEIADYLSKNPKVKLAFQPGTYQIKLGYKALEAIYKQTDVFISNVDEARKILQESGTTSKLHLEPYRGATSINPSVNFRSILKSMHELGPKLVVVTDGPKGAYMFDGDHYYHMPIYPDPRPPLERTGCGDAWASTFVSALAMGRPPLEALVIAPINSMSVAQFIGSQEGLLKLDQMEWWLARAPDEYRPREI